MLVLHHGELVHGQPVVVRGIVEVDHPRLRAADRSLGIAVLHCHAVHQQAMQRAVALDQVRALGPPQLAEGVLDRLCRQRGVETGERIAEALR